MRSTASASVSPAGTQRQNLSPLRFGSRENWESPIAVRRLLLMDPTQAQAQAPSVGSHSASPSPQYPQNLEARVEEAASSLRAVLGQAQKVMKSRSASTDHVPDPRSHKDQEQIRNELRAQWNIKRPEPQRRPETTSSISCNQLEEIEQTRKLNSQKVEELKRELEELQNQVQEEQDQTHKAVEVPAPRQPRDRFEKRAHPTELHIQQTRIENPQPSPVQAPSVALEEHGNSLHAHLQPSELQPELHEQLAQVKQEVNEEESEEDIDMYRDAVKQLTIENARLVHEQRGLQEENDELKRRKPAPRKTDTKELDTLREAVRRLTMESSKLSSQLAAKDEELAELGKKCKEVEDERDYLLIAMDSKKVDPESSEAVRVEMGALRELVKESEDKQRSVEALLQRETILKEDREAELEKIQGLEKERGAEVILLVREVAQLKEAAAVEPVALAEACSELVIPQELRVVTTGGKLLVSNMIQTEEFSTASAEAPLARAADVLQLNENIETVELRAISAEQRVDELQKLLKDAEMRATQADAIAEEALSRSSTPVHDVTSLKTLLANEQVRALSLQTQKDEALQRLSEVESELQKQEADTTNIDNEEAMRVSEDNSRLANELEETKSVLEKLEGKLMKNAAALQKAEESMQEAHDALQKSEQEANEALTRAFQSDAIASDAENRLEQALEALSKAQESASESHKTREGREGEKKALEDALGAVDAELQNEVQNANALQSTLSFREAELDASQAMNEELTAERDKLKALLDSATERADDSIKRLAKLEGELQRQMSPRSNPHVVTLQEQNKLLTDEVATLREKVNHSNTHAKRKLKEMSEKAEAMEGLASKAIKEAKQAKENAKKELEARTVQYEQERGGLKTEVDELRDQVLELAEAENTKANQLVEVRRENEQKEQKLKDVFDKVLAMKEEVQHIGRQLTAANEKLVGANEEKHRLETELADVRSKADLLQSGTSVAEDSALKLEQNRADLMEKLAEAQKHISRLEDENQLLQLDAKAPGEIQFQQVEGALADYKQMLEASEQGFREEVERNERLEARIQMCINQLKVLEEERAEVGEENKVMAEERVYLLEQVKGLAKENNDAAQDKQDLAEKLEQFGWILGQRGSLVRELHKLHKYVGGIASEKSQAGTKKQTQKASHQSLHILNTYLSEIERHHVGLPTIVHPPPEPQQAVSPRQLLRMLEHSPLAATPNRSPMRAAPHTPVQL